MTRELILETSCPEPNTGCWLWLGAADNNGYGTFRGGRNKRKAHRLAYAAFVGPIPEGMHVCHHCDTPACVNPEHLFLGTHADNMADCARKGRARTQRKILSRPRGERHHNVVLSTADVIAIRASSMPQRTLAALYGVCQGTISHIKTGRNRRWE